MTTTEDALNDFLEDPEALIISVSGGEVFFRPPTEETMTDLQIALFASMARILSDDKMFIRKMVHWYLSNDIDLRYYTHDSISK